MLYSLEGIWQARLDGGISGEMRLPGTLDESGLGYRDAKAKKWHPDVAVGRGEEGLIFSRRQKKGSSWRQSGQDACGFSWTGRRCLLLCLPLSARLMCLR